MWINFKNIMMGEISQTQNPTYAVWFHLYEILERPNISGCLRPRVWAENWLERGGKELFEMDGNILTMAVVTWLYTIYPRSSTCTLKMGQFYCTSKKPSERKKPHCYRMFLCFYLYTFKLFNRFKWVFWNCYNLY